MQIEYDLKNIHHSLLSLVLGRGHLTLRGKNISSQWPSDLGAHQLISLMWSPVRWFQLLFLKHWKISSCEGYLQVGGSHFKPGSVTSQTFTPQKPSDANCSVGSTFPVAKLNCSWKQNWVLLSEQVSWKTRIRPTNRALCQVMCGHTLLRPRLCCRPLQSEVKNLDASSYLGIHNPSVTLGNVPR